MTLTAVAQPKQRLLTGPLIALLVISFATLSGFYLLLPVVPAFAAPDGGTVAGLVTGALMLSTVASEFLAPTLISRYGYRWVLLFAVILLGVPIFGLLASDWAPSVLLICLLRGAGLGLFFVAGSSLVAEIVPAERRSEGMGLYGAFVGIPGIIFLPLGVWLADHTGPRSVFVLGAVITLLALAAVIRIPSVSSSPSATVDVEEKRGGLLGPGMVFAAVALAGGVIPTFLPLTVADSAQGWVALALLAQSCTMPLARWAAGRFAPGDGAVVLPFAILVAGAGLLGAVWSEHPALLIAGMTLFGAGFGAAQNITLVVMMNRGGVRRASMLWNATYDIGIGVGAVAFGALTDVTGNRAGFITLVVITAAALPLAARVRRAG
jgi:predicted MFS family arabinose efflux permease